MPKKYKIKISPDRTLGPLDMERVQALVLKGRIQGSEPTSAEPYQSWAQFSSFPELAELLLRKMEVDEVGDRNKPKENKAPESTRTILSAEPTKTMAAPIHDDEAKPEKQTGSFGIPTLVNLPVPSANDNPDLEKTMVNLPVPSSAGVPDVQDESAGGTKILKVENMDLVLQQYAPPEVKTVDGSVEGTGKSRGIFGLPTTQEVDAEVLPNGKKRLLSKNTAALLALGILLIAVWQSNLEEEQDPENILPRFHSFPYIEVNVPPPLVQDLPLSATLTESGQNLIENETPGAYITAIKKFFYPAVGRNVRNYDAKALLASSYIRSLELIPRDEKFFKTVDQLLFPGPPNTQITPEYAVAKAEYFLLLNRYDQAQEVVDAYLKVRPTTELLYQKAKIAYERRELDSALSYASKAIPPEKVKKANPRHLLLYATLLEKKGQKEASGQALSRLIKESPKYGPGILYKADTLYRNAKHKDARKVLKYLVERPSYLDRTQLGETFMLTSKVLEALNDQKRSLIFATAAHNTHFDKETTQDLIFRLKSKSKQTGEAYKQMLAARQKDKARQTELAVNSYIKAIEENRSDPTGYILLAKLYEEQGNIYEAIDRYKKALATSKRPVEAALNLARIYANRFELEEAKGMLNIASDMKKNRDYVSYLRGIIHLKEKRLDLAEPFFEKSLGAGTRIPEIFIQLGELRAKTDQKLAEFYYSMALRYDPLNPQAILGVAIARFFLDSPSRAISFLKDKLAAQPNSAAIMTNLAVIYLRSGDQDSGKNYLQNAIRSDSKYAEAFRLLGDLTKEEGDKQQDNYAARRHSYRYALASYEMYSKLAPNDPEGYKATADLYFDIRDLGAAAKNYYKVLDLTKNYPDVRLRLAQISRNGGDAAKAIELLDQEIKVNPRNDAAYVEKGNIFMAKKDFLTATAAYTEAARINERNADALFGLGVVYHLQGSFDNALSLFARVIKLDPLKADVYWQQGLIYQKLNNTQKAVQAYRDYKGTIRDPQGVARADEKLRELSIR
jgi:tetratricopeptide (TPR) repeat protein